MLYDPYNLKRTGVVWVVLRASSTVPAASELTGAALFDKRVTIERYNIRARNKMLETTGLPDLHWAGMPARVHRAKALSYDFPSLLRLQ